MALLWIEGFESFGTSLNGAPSPAGIIGRKYVTAGESSMDIMAGRLGGYSLQFEGSTTCSMYTSILTTNATMVVGVAVKFKQYHAIYGAPFLYLYDGSTMGVNLRVTPTGGIQICRGATALATTSGLNLLLNTWYYIELKVLCNATTGTYEVRVGGVNVLSNSGVNTKAGANNYHDKIRLYQDPTYTCYPYYDDLYICDGSGTINNNFLGNVRVVPLRPNWPGTSSDLTPNGGDPNYNYVDEIVVDDSTTYVESDTVNHKDTYNYDDLSSVTNIKGLQVNTTCRETDASTFSLITVARSGGVDYEDTPQVIGTTSYVTKTRLLEINPNTTLPWTYTNINNAEFGLKVG